MSNEHNVGHLPVLLCAASGLLVIVIATIASLASSTRLGDGTLNIGSATPDELAPYAIGQLMALRPEELNSSPCVAQAIETKPSRRKYIEVERQGAWLFEAAIEKHARNFNGSPAPAVRERIPCHLTTHYEPCGVARLVRSILCLALPPGFTSNTLSRSCR